MNEPTEEQPAPPKRLRKRLVTVVLPILLVFLVFGPSFFFSQFEFMGTTTFFPRWGAWLLFILSMLTYTVSFILFAYSPRITSKGERRRHLTRASGWVILFSVFIPLGAYQIIDMAVSLAIAMALFILLAFTFALLGKRDKKREANEEEELIEE